MMGGSCHGVVAAPVAVTGVGVPEKSSYLRRMTPRVTVGVIQHNSLFIYSGVCVGGSVCKSGHAQAPRALKFKWPKLVGSGEGPVLSPPMGIETVALPVTQ